MEQYRLFIDDLAESLRGLLPGPGAGRAPDDAVTTQAVGEEGDQQADVTTLAVGEEGDQPGDHATTMAVGEEGDQPDDPTVGLADRLADRFDGLEDGFDDLDDFATDLDDRVAHLADRLGGLASGAARGSGESVATTPAVGDQPEPDPIDTGAPTGTQGIVAGEPYPGRDTDDRVSGDGHGDSHEQVYDTEHDAHPADTAF